MRLDTPPDHLKEKYVRLTSEAVESVEFFRDRYTPIWGKDENEKFEVLVETMTVQAKLIGILSKKIDEQE